MLTLSHHLVESGDDHTGERKHQPNDVESYIEIGIQKHTGTYWYLETRICFI